LISSWKCLKTCQTVKGDSSQVQQVLMNLIINAAEAIEGRKDGVVRITAGVKEVNAASMARIRPDIAPGR
jgi:C4-dicarboxylate-specific signal transduction histidine kinase